MNRLRSAFFALGLLVAASAAQAQTNVKADIPFDFVVGEHSLPAGEYTLVAQSPENQAVYIRSDNGKAAMVTLTQGCSSASPSDKTKLVFHRVGGQYFLSQIWTQGNSSGRELRKSKNEIRMAKNAEKSSDLIVAANLTR